MADAKVQSSLDAFARQLRGQKHNAVTVDHPLKEMPWCKKFAAKFRNVLTPKECEFLIRVSETAGYEQALVNIGGGRQKLMTDYRNSHRVMIDSAALGSAIFSKIRDHLRKLLAEKEFFPPNIGTAYEFNERLRFLRYTGGEFFEQHMDGCYMRPRHHPKAGDRSALTVLLYLNQGYDGATRIFNTSYRMGNQEEHESFHDVEPETGMMFVHDHRLLHSGQPITNGTKYVIRTDIMFTTSDKRLQAEDGKRPEGAGGAKKSQ